MIKPLWNDKNISKYLDGKAANLEKLVIKHFVEVGKAFMLSARNPHTYRNITGGLESSIAFVVIQDGRIVHEDFKLAVSGYNRIVGIAKARAFINTLRSEIPARGVSLIVVAGAEYAAYVEARGHDVITGSSLGAKKHLRQAVEDIKRNAMTDTSINYRDSRNGY